MKKFWLLAVLLLAGCSTFTLIEPGNVSINDLYSVQPGIKWSQVKSGDIQYWTVNGSDLESIHFTNAIQEGKPIVSLSGDLKETPYRADMTESDIVEAVVSAFSLEGGQQVEARNLRPASFGGLDGFRFEVGFRNTDGLEKESAVVATIHDQSLYLIIYTGIKIHYFPRYAGEFENIVQSIRLNKAG